MTLTGKVFAAGALVALIGLPISSVLAQSTNSMGADASASAPASNSMGSDASASAPAPSSMNDSSASASAPAQAAQVDDATLQKAAKAYVKVKQIVHQTKQASSDSASAQPAQAAQSEKIAAVKGEGLDIQQYNQVLQTVQNDPQLQQKFASYVTQNGGDTD